MPITGLDVIFLTISIPMSSKHANMKASDELLFSISLTSFETFVVSR